MREAAIYNDDFPRTVVLCVGGGPMPKVGERVEVENFKTGESKEYKVVERIPGTDEYKAEVV